VSLPSSIFSTLPFLSLRAFAVMSLLAVPLLQLGCSKSEPDDKKEETSAQPAAAERPAGGPGRGGPGGANRREADPIPVQVAAVTRGPIAASLAFNSTLETESIVDIYPRINGQVDQLLVEEGDFVSAGTPLLKIDDRELRVDADGAKVALEREQVDFARTEGLFQRGLVNEQEFENDRFALSQAQLRADRARIRYDYATVVAPFDGVISEREVQVGARVATGTKLFSFVSLKDMVAKVFVPGRYLTEIAVDQSAEITSEFLPDQAYAAWVKRISPIIDPASGTFKVTVGVREPGAAIVPGLFVRASITTEERPQALLIPKRAVVYEGGSQYVFTVRRGRAMRLALDAGFENPNHIEVRSGLEEGDEVVVLGQSGLKDRSPVKIVDPVMPSEDDTEEES
jgi:membrane fusion protein (multidrug efflux system)